ncbi:MAG TPA: helix-turn-helix transcriptional regulator [Rickettsia endosymbiont of Omalisus fontisbellaquei]|nr:helix-turn-helix transcriptional regulator [Rickettsia endosymbiont of Omalisus fontisbellaquei]
MSYVRLKKNIENFLKENNYNILELEKKASVKRGNISNILEGKSKRPSAELLQSIANVFCVTVEDLLDNNSVLPALSVNDLELITKLTQAASTQIINLNLNLTYAELTSIIKKMYNYHKDAQKIEVDETFLKWFLKNRHAL